MEQGAKHMEGHRRTPCLLEILKTDGLPCQLPVDRLGKTKIQPDVIVNGQAKHRS